MPPIVVRGIAHEVTFVPAMVLSDYRRLALPKCVVGRPALDAVIGTRALVTAAIRRVAGLKKPGNSPMVINMSLIGASLETLEMPPAIDEAIAEGASATACGHCGAPTAPSRRRPPAPR